MSTRIHSKRVEQRIAPRCSGFSPSAFRPEARSRTRSNISRQLTFCHPPFSGYWYASTSGVAATRLTNRPGTVSAWIEVTGGDTSQAAGRLGRGFFSAPAL